VSRAALAVAAGAVLVVAIVTIATGGSGSSATGHAPALSLRIFPEQRSNRFQPGAIGLSIEASQLSSAVIAAGDRSLVALMRRLGPATLRIGGNSADRAWWTARAEAKPGWATSTLTPVDLEHLRRLLDATDWQTVLTVNLGHFDPRRAASEAEVAARILGPRLRAIEIGNEPNAFGTSVKTLRKSTYGVGDYLRELDVYRSHIEAAAPGVEFAGPDLSFAPSSHTWLPEIAAVSPSPFKELTHHYYSTAYNLPDGHCSSTPLPTARELLLPPVREYENTVIGRLTTAGAIAHRPTVFSETNTTTSCNAAGGPDTSPVFASALWALDWSLRAASAGVSGLNFHGKLGRCSAYSFSPVCIPRSSRSEHPLPRPVYSGLLAATYLEGGRFVRVELGGARAAGGDVTAYATRRRKGKLTLAVIDFLPRGRPSVAISVPGYTAASTRLLRAPSIHAKSRIRFGGKSLGSEGSLRPPAKPLKRQNGSFRLVLPAGTAQIVTLVPAPR
jgi:hypothetical protein